MQTIPYTLDRFVADLRRITATAPDERSLLAEVRPLARRCAMEKAWLAPSHYEAPAEQGFGAHLLHEEADHALAVFAVSWLPGRGAPPHDHGTWAVIVGVDGPEKNSFWTRTDDRSRPGHADVHVNAEKVCAPGDVIAMPAGWIHSVVNESDRVSLSFHVYGRHFNFTERSRYDPDARAEMPYKVKLGG